MTKFEVGGNFIPRKPKDTTQFPGWNSAMDKFNGQILTISKINRDGMLEGTESECYCFHPDWCEKVESIPSVTLEDLGSFPNGFSGNPVYNHIKASALSPQPKPLSTEIDWEQRRYELAKEFMAAQMTWASVDRETTKENITKSIEIANEIIKQLKQQ